MNNAEWGEMKAATPPKTTPRTLAFSISRFNHKDTSTKQQLQSRFFALPKELRLQIHEELVSKRDGIHVMFWQEACTAVDVSGRKI
jgi:hypothetical protein